jgi:dATP/dGTP diphosphohydrolase
VVSAVAGFGAEKYERYNFLRGYPWSWSFDALQRHLLAFWAGEDLDPESGQPHLAHAAWHALALTGFQRRAIGTDDRPPKAAE